MTNLKIGKAYAVKPLMSTKNHKKIVQPTEQIKAAKGIFITSNEDDDKSKPPTSHTHRGEDQDELDQNKSQDDQKGLQQPVTLAESKPVAS